MLLIDITEVKSNWAGVFGVFASNWAGVYCKESGLMVTSKSRNTSLPCSDEKPCSNPHEEVVWDFSDSIPFPALVKQ